MNIKIPDSVERIRDGAFVACEHLKSIVIPDSVIDIGEHAFFGCESLTSVRLPKIFLKKSGAWWKKRFDKKVIGTIIESNSD